MDRPTIAFIGVGLMGYPMARHLLEAGYRVIAHDVVPERLEAIVQWGARRAADLRAIGRDADVVILSLPSSEVVNQVVNEELRLAESARPGLVLIDTTTADPQMSVALARELAAKGIAMLDATISGTSEMCAAKDILFMVGGRKEVFEACVPLFSALGREAVHLGDNGAGATAKLVVNLVLGLNRMALAEGLTLARQAGLEERRALEVLRASAAFSRVMEQKGMRMVERRFVPAAGKLGFYYKDVRLMLALGARLDCPLPLISLHAQALASEMAKGRAEWDSADIISFYDGLVGYAPQAATR